jgi:hypothetical protein
VLLLNCTHSSCRINVDCVPLKQFISIPYVLYIFYVIFYFIPDGPLAPRAQYPYIILFMKRASRSTIQLGVQKSTAWHSPGSNPYHPHRRCCILTGHFRSFPYVSQFCRLIKEPAHLSYQPSHWCSPLLVPTFFLSSFGHLSLALAESLLCSLFGSVVWDRAINPSTIRYVRRNKNAAFPPIGNAKA